MKTWAGSWPAGRTIADTSSSVGSQQVIRADGSPPSSGIRVEGDQHPSAAEVRHLAQGPHLLGGERRAARRDARTTPGAGGGHRDGVERAFHDDRPRPRGDHLPGFPQPEQRRRPCRYRQVRGLLTYLGTSGPASSGARPMNAATVPSAERIGSTARSRKVSMSVPRLGPAGEPSSLDERVREAECPQIAGERVPSRWRVTGLPSLLDGWTEPASLQVTGNPAIGQPAAEEPQRDLVELGNIAG